jgi:membrane protein implicated in regulation of membrane protease activity
MLPRSGAEPVLTAAGDLDYRHASRMDVTYLPYVWAAFGILLMASEMLIPGFVIFFFGIGAVATGVLSGLLPFLRTRFLLQTIVWLGSSALSLGLLRRLLAPVFRGGPIEPGASRDLVGVRATVAEKITPDKPGRVRLRGTTWQARSFDETLEPGETVEVLGNDNLTLIVTRSIVGDREEDA